MGLAPFSVSLGWDPSTDNDGVVGYDVFRDGTLLKQLSTVTTYTDSTVLASSTYQYAVRARDTSGNVSPLSTPLPVTTPAAATPVFSDGFENGNLNAWTPKGGLTVQSGTVRSGSFAAEGNPSATTAYAKKTLSPTYSDAYARVAFNIVSQASQVTLLRLRDTASGMAGGYLFLTTGGKLAFHSDTPSTTTQSNVSPGSGWHALELHLNIGSGLVEVWLDGAAVPELTFTSTALGTSPIGNMQIGDTAFDTWHGFLDDAVFSDSRIGI